MRIFIFFIAVMLVNLAHAAQIRLAESDGEIAGIVSMREVNRIAVQDDRIRAVAKTPNGWAVEHDDITGDVFLIPQQVKEKSPVNLFITTEGGHTFQLLLSPRDIPSEQILIRTLKTDLPANPSVRIELRKDHLAELIRLMRTGSLHKDYQRMSGEGESLPFTLHKNANQINIEDVWQGKSLTGWYISFVSTRNIPTHQLVHNASAIWLEWSDIAPRQHAIIIMERDNERRE